MDLTYNPHEGGENYGRGHGEEIHYGTARTDRGGDGDTTSLSESSNNSEIATSKRLMSLSAATLRLSSGTERESINAARYSLEGDSSATIAANPY
jgi:hypothetical protein